MLYGERDLKWDYFFWFGWNFFCCAVRDNLEFTGEHCWTLLRRQWEKSPMRNLTISNGFLNLRYFWKVSNVLRVLHGTLLRTLYVHEFWTNSIYAISKSTLSSRIFGQKVYSKGTNWLNFIFRYGMQVSLAVWYPYEANLNYKFPRNFVLTSIHWKSGAEHSNVLAIICDRVVNVNVSSLSLIQNIFVT